MGDRAMRVEETALPGIGVRHDIVTERGRRVGILSYRNGRRDLVVYDDEDPDTCVLSLPLAPEESNALAEILGAPRVVERLAALHEQAAGLITTQVPVAADSSFDGRTLGDTQARTRTGASIVAVLRRGEVALSPGPDFVFAAEDRVIVVGTREGTAAVAEILAG